MEKEHLKKLIDTFKQAEVIENIIEDLNKAAQAALELDHGIKITVETQVKILPEKKKKIECDNFFELLGNEMQYVNEIREAKKNELNIELNLDDRASMKVMDELIRVMGERKAALLKKIDSLK